MIDRKIIEELKKGVRGENWFDSWVGVMPWN